MRARSWEAAGESLGGDKFEMDSSDEAASSQYVWAFEEHSGS